MPLAPEAEKIVANLIMYTQHKEGCMIGKNPQGVFVPCSCGLNKAIGNLYKISEERRARQPIPGRSVDEVTYFKITDGKDGMHMFMHVPPEITSMELLLAILGGLRTAQLDVHKAITSFRKAGLTEIDNIIGEQDGFDPNEKPIQP